ncbi:MAG: 1-acyl-sn-glycerol-3-phosphate acyltransferase [Deltaproteobacteria bacterium]|nr:1-acyl-sn-glycerol-3-phosphate acyltransferase [Deltaproteobacteria bacterium]
MSGLRLAAGFAIVAISAVITIILAIPLLPWRVLRIRLCNVYGKLVGPSVLWVTGARIHFEDRDRINASAPAIYVANHTSTLDAFLSIWLCPMNGCGVMKKENLKIPFFGWLYVLSGHLVLDRGNHDKAVRALDRTAELVKRHHVSVWIMAEGTRSPDGRLQKLKPGFVHLAIQSGLKVVPVVFIDAHKVWPAREQRLIPGGVTVRVLPPVDTSGWKVEAAQAHADEIHARFAAALPEPMKPATMAEVA